VKTAKTKKSYIPGSDPIQDYARFATAKSLKLFHAVVGGTHGKGIHRYGAHPRRWNLKRSQKGMERRGYFRSALDVAHDKSKKTVLIDAILGPIAYVIDVQRYREALSDPAYKTRVQRIRKTTKALKKYRKILLPAILFGGAALLYSAFGKKAS